jgi:putative inorganic carbon (HCO3(-)) transporter
MVQVTMETLYRYSPILFFLLITRASLDPILNATQAGGIGFGAVLNLLMLLLLLALTISNKFKLPMVVLKMWSLFLVIGLISITISPDKITSLRSFFSVFTYFAVFVIPFHFVTSKAAYVACIKVILYSSFIPILFVANDLIVPEASTTKDGFRLFSTFTHPNIFAFYMVVIGSLSLYILKSSIFVSDRRLKQIASIVLFASLLCLLGTKTRSAWLAMVVVVAVYAVFSEKKYLLYLAAFACIAMTIPNIQDRVLDVFTSGGNDVNVALAQEGSLNSYAWRKLVWISSWGHIQASPFFGHGYAMFSYYFLDFFVLESSSAAEAHNAYVQIAFDMGFLGLLGYLLLLGQMFKKCWVVLRNDKGNSVVLGLFIAFCFVNYSDNMLFYLSFNWYFWFFFGAFFAYHNIDFKGMEKTFEGRVRGVV